MVRATGADSSCFVERSVLPLIIIDGGAGRGRMRAVRADAPGPVSYLAPAPFPSSPENPTEPKLRWGVRRRLRQGFISWVVYVQVAYPVGELRVSTNP